MCRPSFFERASVLLPPSSTSADLQGFEPLGHSLSSSFNHLFMSLSSLINLYLHLSSHLLYLSSLITFNCSSFSNLFSLLFSPNFILITAFFKFSEFFFQLRLLLVFFLLFAWLSRVGKRSRLWLSFSCFNKTCLNNVSFAMNRPSFFERASVLLPPSSTSADLQGFEQLGHSLSSSFNHLFLTLILA